MRLVYEARQPLREPMIAASLLARAIHSLLDNHPPRVVGDDESMQVEIEAVLHGGAVDLGDEPAGAGERRAVEAHALAGRDQLMRGLPRMPAPSAADVDAKLFRQRSQAALEGADHAGGDAGGM